MKFDLTKYDPALAAQYFSKYRSWQLGDPLPWRIGLTLPEIRARKLPLTLTLLLATSLVLAACGPTSDTTQASPFSATQTAMSQQIGTLQAMLSATPVPTENVIIETPTPENYSPDHVGIPISFNNGHSKVYLNDHGEPIFVTNGQDDYNEALQPELSSDDPNKSEIYGNDSPINITNFNFHGKNLHLYQIGPMPGKDMPALIDSAWQDTLNLYAHLLDQAIKVNPSQFTETQKAEISAVAASGGSKAYLEKIWQEKVQNDDVITIQNAVIEEDEAYGVLIPPPDPNNPVNLSEADLRSLFSGTSTTPSYERMFAFVHPAEPADPKQQLQAADLKVTTGGGGRTLYSPDTRQFAIYVNPQQAINLSPNIKPFRNPELATTFGFSNEFGNLFAAAMPKDLQSLVSAQAFSEFQLTPQTFLDQSSQSIMNMQQPINLSAAEFKAYQQKLISNLDLDQLGQETTSTVIMLQEMFQKVGQ